MNKKLQHLKTTKKSLQASRISVEGRGVVHFWAETATTDQNPVNYKPLYMTCNQPSSILESDWFLLGNRPCSNSNFIVLVTLAGNNFPCTFHLTLLGQCWQQPKFGASSMAFARKLHEILSWIVELFSLQCALESQSVVFYLSIFMMAPGRVLLQPRIIFLSIVISFCNWSCLLSNNPWIRPWFLRKGHWSIQGHAAL